MARLTDMLAPGERVVHRVSILPRWLPALIAVTGLVLAVPAIFQLAAGSEDIVVETVRAAVGLFALAAAVRLYAALRTGPLLVTDRRLLMRNGDEGYEELPLAEIEAVTPYRLGDGLFVTGGTQKIVVPCKQKAADRIRAAIAAAKGTVQWRG
jgi:hypothetical protein